MPYKNSEAKKIYFREWQKRNPILMREYRHRCYMKQRENRLSKQRERYIENPKHFNEISKHSYHKHKEKILIATTTYRKLHPEVQRKSAQKWRQNNLALDAAKSMARHALKLMAMPQWIKRETIAKIYIECRMKSLSSGIPHEVDHIWPLHGKDFVGLHVPWNLRIITRQENIKKGNKRPS